MKKTHFFKAYSRLGLINPPYGSQKLNYGVETAPDFILSDAFLSKFDSFEIDSQKFPLPESIDKNLYQNIIAQESAKFTDLINQKLAQDQIQVVVGGDHSVGYPSMLAVLERYTPEEVAYIHIDSHADTSSMLDSPSQNFHGQFLRALMDPNFHQAFEKNIPNLLLAENTFIIGDLEADDFDFIKESGIHYAKGENTPEIIETIKKIMSTAKHLHIGFDIDVFKQDLVSATGTPNHWGGLDVKNIFSILEYLATYQDISIDLVEVNPKKEFADPTILMAQKVLETLLLP